MSGTDAYVDGAVAPSLDVEVRKEIQRLRKLLLFPNDVHLFTRPVIDSASVDGVSAHVERWITDRYIMVNVTGSPALMGPPVEIESVDATVPAAWPDGGYKLTAGKGLVPKPDAFLPDSAGMLDSIERPGIWERLFRTQWSMADSDAKLMLAYTAQPEEFKPAIPYAVNEEIWVAFEEAFPGEDDAVTFAVCEDRPYQVRNSGKVVGYIARAEFPDDKMREDALRVAEAVAKR